MSSYQSYMGGGGKTRTKVKPILKKLTQSESNSLDLDRPAAEQNTGGIEIYNYGNRSSHDVATSRRGYHHRSTSSASQFSTTTTGSGHRTFPGTSSGSFIHPFQQTQTRPFTPPPGLGASYQNSLREDEHDGESAHNRSPVLTEDEEQFRHHNIRSASNISNRTPSITGPSTSPVISNPLRLQTKNNSASRLALATSHTSLHNFSELGSPTETMSPASAIRTSMDKGFRIRSRSEVDSRPRAETIQEARRKFQEKEQLKEEKAARQEIKALEKKQHKEAKEIDRQHRRSSASEATRSKRSRSDLTSYEKGDGLVARDYNSASYQEPPLPADEAFQSPRPRSHTTKQKTHSAWTKFVMWLRTRILRMNKKRKP
jgi:hypothetical protein